MPTYTFEAMDATGQEIRDEIDAANEDEAQTTIRQMGYFVTKIAVKKQAAGSAGAGGGKKRPFAMGGAKTKHICAFTRQLSILQDAGLPILRSLKILEGNQKPGKLKNALMDVCDEIEGGSTLSEAMAKCPKVFSRLYVNMIKAGEAGGALETILNRLADFLESAESLKRKVKGALIYPVIVVLVATLILTFIMLFIVPTFEKMFDEFGLDLPAPTVLLIAMSNYIAGYWFLLILMPICALILVKLMRKFKQGRIGFDMFIIRVPIFGTLIEKNILARTTRTLGTLISSGVPILEALNITRETAGNAMFERMFTGVSNQIREGEVISKPLKEYSVLGFHPMTAVFWALFGSFPGIMVMSVALTAKGGKLDDGTMVEMLTFMSSYMIIGGAVLCVLFYLTKIKGRVVDDLVVNMVDVGEETGELDTMLYKVADTYDEEVRIMTDALTALMEPLMIVFLGVAVGFIVISLFMPLVELISGLS
ncbi:type II secretion system F family protein [Rhodopirellula baltica]|uniref:Type IV fimbrial assembly protein PilC n=4 Tax=Rhodopirellula baltica TaxID=265606 RepID=Q7UI38_RHOBA|nr:type II secretion system F family protein [Rhodopirellula baltica]EGF24602.1 Type II secretion system F domain protein [Rhodopirellula baltica WH47]EKK01861.1 Type II secretion system F domain protein [Rhodopirellula baltica SH28]ELP30359.1 Type II secretion system F domain protein [Rhodopirellula baltica SWK14]CAD77776.1 type IV fimbrial assembly protein PilC [Rhodopirellula baltica SH 1]HBE61855.1 type II secretion system F family protein [Rhodopirellula baltica]